MNEHQQKAFNEAIKEDSKAYTEPQLKTYCSICGKASDMCKSDGTRLWCEKCITKAMNARPKNNKSKQQRNDNCNCKSGKKYKHCCID